MNRKIKALIVLQGTKGWWEEKKRVFLYLGTQCDVKDGCEVK